ncbi:Polyamine transporter 4 [Savitreella phatthalungensis]
MRSQDQQPIDMQVEKDALHIREEGEPVLLSMSESDPEHPYNMSLARRVYQTVIVSLMTMAAAWSSSIFSGSLPEFVRLFDLDYEVSVLSIALFTLGFTLGPIVFGPLSEGLGRQLLYLTAFFLFIIFHLLVGFAQDAAAVLIGRFLEGAFGSVMLPLIAGSTSDMWPPVQRAFVMAFGVSTIFASPALGPIIGSFTAVHLGWRWTSWLVCIFGGLLWLLTIPMKETYVPVLLKRRALKMRKEGHNVIAPLEAHPITLKQVVPKYLIRPFVMLVTEPALLFVSIYTAIGYALLYSFLLAYNFVFQGIRRFSFTLATLPLLGVIVGVVVGAICVVSFNPSYRRSFIKLGHPDVERRLHPMLPGAVALPTGLFLFAWTAPYSSIHWIVPTIAGVFAGMGIICIFMSSMLFCSDCYGPYAASAVSANVMLRSLLATAFILFTRRMLVNMSVQGSFSMLGGIGVVAMFGPVLLIKYGQSLRKNSKWGMVYQGE